jgi:hypothetical protein
MKAEYFKIQELVPPCVYSARGNKAWELIDDRLIYTIDQLRRKFGTTIINTWHSGGDQSQSGLRTYEYYLQDGNNEIEFNKRLVEAMLKFNKSYSQHKYGRAADCLFSGVTADEVREYIFTNPHKFEYINGIERNVSWLHIDVRNSDILKVF